MIKHVAVRLDRPLCGCRKPPVSTEFDFDPDGSLWLLVHCVMCKKGVRTPVEATEFRVSWPTTPRDTVVPPSPACQATTQRRENMSNPETIERAARTAHEVNRVYVLMLGGDAGEAWETSSEAQQASVRAGVQMLADAPLTTPAESHIAWMERKTFEGWRYGPEKSEERQTHPCLLGYAELPPEQRTKDHIFRAVVLGVFGIPDASYAVSALEGMRNGMDQIMSQADTAVKAVNLTVEATPEDRAEIPVHEARANLAGAVSAELAAVICTISGMPARG